MYTDDFETAVRICLNFQANEAKISYQTLSRSGTMKQLMKADINHGQINLFLFRESLQS